jgi:UDP-2-acetamido-3-amino-2,3-dideoxy-glucuronate N-acetyltransferase
MPDAIRAQGSNFLHQKIADTTVTLLSFPSGVKAHIFVSWLHPFKEQKLIVVGDKKMAVFNDTAPWSKKLLLYPHTVEWTDNIPVANKADAIPVTLKEEEPLRAECLHFLQCIYNRRPPRTDGQEGLRVLQVLNACQASLEQERQRSLNPADTFQKEGNFFVHETAVVDNNVMIGEKSKIWHFSHLLSGTSLGKGCTVGQNVTIGPNVAIGNTCKIQNNVSVYEGVTLEDKVFCGPSMVFTNVYNPRCDFPRKNQFDKTLVQEGATLGANCTIVCGVTIGKYAFIGAGAVITRDVPDFALMVGNPARQIGWMSRFGERLALPLTGKGRDECPHTGEKYRLEKGRVTLCK